MPAASDGKTVVSIFGDHRDIRDGIYIWQGWFPSYLAAASMAIFGSTAFGARFPFAVAFIVFIAVYYSLLNKRGESDRRLWLTLGLSVSCVPLLLHARQCRYYILVPLLSLLIIAAYLSLLERPKIRHQFPLVLWTTLLLNSFFPGAVLLGLALVIDLIRRRPSRSALKLLGIATAIILIVNLPMAWFCRIWDRRFGGESGHVDVPAVAMYLLRYLLTLNNYFFPLVLIVVACALKWKAITKNLLNDQLSFLFLTICLTQMVGFSVFSDYPFTRYLIGIAPMVIYFGATCIEAVAFGRQWIVWLLALIAAGSNFLHVLPLPLLRLTKLNDAQWTTGGVDLHFIDPDHVRFSYARGEIKALLNVHAGFPFIGYLRSIVRPPPGPIDLIVDYLGKNATPNDHLKITYGDLPLIFHTDLTVLSSVATGPPGPEWIVSRHFRPLRTDDAFFRESSSYRYLPITIPFPDLQWNNQPDPLYHYYHTPPNDLAPPITILKKQ